jgi:CheY-like chemotaxis protein
MARILIIDDDDAFRGMLRQVLEREGYQVVEARNGLEGMQHYRAAPSDLVITDILMPEQEGLETTRRLRQEYPEAKIIAISGGGRTGTQDFLLLAKRFGAQHTLWKPFPRQALLEAVHTLVGR